MLSVARQKSILVHLADAGVEAIVVGMTSAVIQGVPTTTWDYDALLPSMLQLAVAGHSVRVLALEELLSINIEATLAQRTRRS